MDVTRIINDLLPAPDGETPMRHRTGIITQVNGNGTVDLTLGDETVNSVSVLRGVVVESGDNVQVASWAGDLLVLGTVADHSTDLGFSSPFMRSDEVSNAGPNNIPTAETVQNSVTLVIPTNWGGYRIEAFYKADILETGTLTAVRSVTLRLRLTNAAGTQLTGATSIYQIDTVAPNRSPVPCNGYLTGQTTTGNVVVCSTSEIGADTNQAGLANMVLMAKAWRTA